MNTLTSAGVEVHLYLLGQTRALGLIDQELKELPIQPKPLHLLAYLGLNGERPHRREALRALFWPDKPPLAAANNLRQALWHLRQALPPETLHLQDDWVGLAASRLWVDALAFKAALDADDLDAALDLYAGPLLPDAYDEWAQLERERIRLGYLTALETRAQRRYEFHRWEAALADVETLLSADPLNELATRLAMACHWALDQREAARRCYDAYRDRVHDELKTDPLAETINLYQRILRGETHPDQTVPPPDTAAAGRAAHLSLLETLGAFNRGLEQAAAWVEQTDGSDRAAALRWQGRFYLRMGRLQDACATLTVALSLASTPDLQVDILADQATTKTGLGDYAAAEAHYAQALRLSPLRTSPRLRLLSSLGGLQGRMGRIAQARITLEEAVRLARTHKDLASLAIASGNLGILLIDQGEPQAAQTTLREALDAARQADAHWLTAYLTGHLGVLAQDSGDLEAAAGHYQRARTLAETIGDQRSAILWTLNLGIVRYEQGRCSEAIPLLTKGQERAAAQGSRSLDAGARIFIGACQTVLGKEKDGLLNIESGLTLAQQIGDQQRVLMGLLHQGRALAALGQVERARATLQRGLREAQSSRVRRMEDYIRTELENLPLSP